MKKLITRTEKAELNFYEQNCVPYYECGIKLRIFDIDNSKIFPYSWKNEIYFAFDKTLEFNIGTRFDLASSALFFIILTSQEQEDDWPNH
ncbi:MAG TPA: hypothetical protein VFC68_01800 [Treponemataceae bacterium]|nr:hypothetical protein [Treponemataceae bacterium]